MSQLKFDPAIGITAPQTAEVRAVIQSQWISAFDDGSGAPPLNVESSSPAGQLIDSEVAEVQAKNSELLYLANMFNPRVSDGRWQDAIGYIYFLERKLAEPTVVTCQLTGLNGTSIPYGALVKNVEGYTLICNKAVSINSAGFAETTFRVSQTGAIEIPKQSVNQIVTVIPGWDTINNAVSGATGRDVETRAEFEQRRYASVANNAHGSVAAIYGTIANINGVIDCRVLENRGSVPKIEFGVTIEGHSVAVCAYGGDDTDIAKAIYQKKDAGCGTTGNSTIKFVSDEPGNPVYEYSILRPNPVEFNVQIKIANIANLSSEVLSALKKAIVIDFLGSHSVSGNSRVGLATTVYASRFYIAVMEIEGINELDSIQVALGNKTFTNSITINANQEPVMTEDNVFII